MNLHIVGGIELDMQNERMIITCDIDGILTDYPNCWLEYLEEKCGTLYNSTQEAKASESKYSLYKDMYRESEYKANLPMNEHNKDILNKLSQKYDIVFTTSRPINNKDKYPNLYENTFNWLKNNGLRFKELRFKDINGDFLNDIDISFHIDDEAEYANSVSKKLKEKKNNLKGGIPKVYCLTVADCIEELDNDVIIIKDIEEIDNPFFSICIPATNRGETIYRALKSITEQTYRNFEVVIVNCNSIDETNEEIERFFESNDYNRRKFEYKYIQLNYTPKGTEDWNDPLKYAKGRYIAMLEGDDYWLSDHLMNAYRAISNNSNIGVYGASNKNITRPFQGVLKNARAKRYCYIMRQGVVPPSESVFIRVNKQGVPFFYNSEEYHYSPEISLYLDIILDGKDLYYSQIKDVFREPSTNEDKMKTWYYYADRFVLIDNYKNYFSKWDNIKAKLYNALLIVYISCHIKSNEKRNNLIKSLWRELCKR